MFSKNIAVYNMTEELEATAKALANKLQLPLIKTVQKIDYSHLLLVTPDYIGVQHVGLNQVIYEDFASKQWQYRRQKLSIKNEALARALGLKSKTRPTIVDATGGLARDSFILAALGFPVTLLERSPIVSTLITDSINRGKQHQELVPILERITFVQANAISWLYSLVDKPDIIYLDPMFPERKKSALPKKEMLIFQDIVGDDTDANTLLLSALTCATRRVVVKRPRLSSSLIGICSPSFSLIGSSCRFDIYLI